MTLWPWMHSCAVQENTGAERYRSRGYTASMEGRRIGNDFEVGGHSLFTALSRHLPRGTEENQWKPQDNKCPWRDSNRVPPE
jgi:hypothetical protein